MPAVLTCGADLSFGQQMCSSKQTSDEKQETNLPQNVRIMLRYEGTNRKIKKRNSLWNASRLDQKLNVIRKNGASNMERMILKALNVM